jgi:starch synthase
MRVGILTREFPPEVYGGAGVHVAELTRALAGRVDVAVHCFGQPRSSPLVVGTYEPWERVVGVPGASGALGPMSVDLAMVAQLSDVDVVHSHTWYANLAGHLAQLCWGVPHVATTHSLEPRRPWKAEQLGAGGYRLSTWCERVGLEGAAAVVAVSEAMRADILACYPALSDERVRVIHNGIDPDLWRPSPPERVAAVLARHGVERDRPIVLFVGRITRQKGLVHLLSAASRLTSDAQLVLLAGAADTEELAAEVRRAVADVAARRPVTWIEEMLDSEEVRAFYTAATLFVCPSVYEPFGLVNLEAMACGTAVVASAVGGIPEIVVPGQTGLLVDVDVDEDGEVRDPAAFVASMAAAIDELATNPERAAAYGTAGRERVVADFSWAQVASETIRLYEEVRQVSATGADRSDIPLDGR